VGQGKIINIASVQSELARARHRAYTATKGAIRNLTRGMCTDWAKYGLQINAIAPGYFKTPLNQALVDNPEFSSWLEKRTPAGRWATSRSWSAPPCSCPAKASSFVNGHTPLCRWWHHYPSLGSSAATRWAEFRFDLRKLRASLMKFCTAIDVSCLSEHEKHVGGWRRGPDGLNTISSVVKRAIDCGTSATPKPAAIKLGTDCASMTCWETCGRKPASTQHFWM
jgi:hypothetical protein